MYSEFHLSYSECGQCFLVQCIAGGFGKRKFTERGDTVANQKFTDMRSVSLTEAQGNALDKQAAKEGRKAGNLIRLAVCNYLRAEGALPALDCVGDIDEDEE